jgi:hypothetical protein
MRAFLTSTLFCSLLILCIGCSDDPPSVRVRNDFSKKANVQFKTGGNTFNINDVATGTSTNFQDVAEAEHVATASIQGESTAPTATFTAKNNNNYTVVITNTTPPAMRVDVEEK